MTVNITISLLDTLHAIAVDAGKAILEVYNSDFHGGCEKTTIAP